MSSVLQSQPVADVAHAVGLTASGLSKSFGSVAALAGVDLAVAPGESVAVMGPSGCGKSTLLHCLAGILTPDHGDVVLGGETLSAFNESQRSRVRREQFGFVFQDGQLLSELTNAENVGLPLMLTGVSRREAVAHGSAWLARMGLQGTESRRPTQLSGGQQQRVAIARALAHRPRVVFADEPTGALDQTNGQHVIRILTAACAEAGASLVLVTHDAQIAGWCARTVAMCDGRIIQEFHK